MINCILTAIRNIFCILLFSLFFQSSSFDFLLVIISSLDTVILYFSAGCFLFLFARVYKLPSGHEIWYDVFLAFICFELGLERWLCVGDHKLFYILFEFNLFAMF